MIIKRICCEVKEGYQERFHEFQKQWSVLNEHEGFLGQLGGWDSTQALTAYIYAFWEDLVAYQMFMSNEHDQIFVHSGQDKTYHTIDVSLYETRMVRSEENQIGDMIKGARSMLVDVFDLDQSPINYSSSIGKVHLSKDMQILEGNLDVILALSLENHDNAILIAELDDESDPSDKMKKDRDRDRDEHRYPFEQSINRHKRERIWLEEDWRVSSIENEG